MTGSERKDSPTPQLPHTTPGAKVQPRPGLMPSGWLPCQGSHKNLKTEFHDFSMTDLLLSMTPLLTWFRIRLWLSHNMHDNHKLESCHSHENKQFWLFHDIQLLSMTFWEIFIFQDFSMTAIFSRISHDRGNPACDARPQPPQPVRIWLVHTNFDPDHNTQSVHTGTRQWPPPPRGVWSRQDARRPSALSKHFWVAYFAQCRMDLDLLQALLPSSDSLPGVYTWHGLGMQTHSRSDKLPRPGYSHNGDADAGWMPMTGQWLCATATDTISIQGSCNYHVISGPYFVRWSSVTSDPVNDTPAVSHLGIVSLCHTW